MSTKKAVAKSAGIIGSGIFLSRILGFIRDMVIANFFGTGIYAQAFVVAFRIPNMLRDFAAEGATNAAFVPVLSEYRIKGDKEDFWNLASVILNILIVALLAIVALGVISSPWIVRLMAPGFIPEPEKLNTAIFLNRIMFPYIFFIGLASFSMGLLNTLKHFTAPSLASSASNLALIILVCLFRGDLKGLYCGVLAGGFLQFFIQVPVLIKKGFKFKLFRLWKHPGALKIGKLLIPRVASSGIYQLNLFINTVIASFSFIVGDGAVAALYFASRLFQFPLAVFGLAFSQAVLPTMSDHAVCGEIGELKKKLSFGLRAAFLLVIPSSIGLMVLARPIVRVLFERGEFGPYSTAITSGALTFYCLGLFAYTASNILISGFFSLKDTVTPAKISGIALFTNVLLNLILMRPLKVSGIALGMSLSGILSFLLLFLALRKKIGPLGGKEILGSVIRILIASLLMGLVCWFSHRWLFSSFPANAPAAVYLGLVIAGSLLSFVLIAFILRISEMRDLAKWVFRRRENK